MAIRQRQAASPDEAYTEALRRIQRALVNQTKRLDLGGLGLIEIVDDRGGYQRLTGVPKNLGELPWLIQLFLNDNRLTHVPIEVRELGELTTLDLSNNQLTSLPEGLGASGTLKELFLHRNPDLGIPPEVLGPPREDCKRYGGSQQPAKAAEILAYYDGLQKSGEATKIGGAPRPLNEAKIIVVGEPAVGKTELIHWLIHNTPHPDPKTTRGILIDRWNIPSFDGAEIRSIKANVWDFGGQEIMQATHQFFLTQRSLYVLVLDSRKNEHQNQFRTWMERIRAFGAESPVIVVLNQRDHGRLDPDEPRLRIDYIKNILDPFFRTACRDGEGAKAGDGIGELRNAIQLRAQNLEGVNTPVPQNFHAAKELVEEAARKTGKLSHEEYHRYCARSGLSSIEEDSLLTFLRNCGTLHSYAQPGKPNQVRRTFVLDPAWLTGGVYRILTDAELKDVGGVLTPVQLDRIFSMDATYPPEDREFILDMMEGEPFELSFRIPDCREDRLIPEQLSPHEPAHGITPENSLNIIYHYHYLPGGLMPRFIVRMHHVLELGHRWKNGAVLNIDQRRVLVRALRGDNGKIFVSAERRETDDKTDIVARRALAVVRQNLDLIHRSMPHLRVDERVPLPDNLSVTVGYAYLIKLENNPNKGPTYEWTPEGADRDYSVRELLDGIEEPEWRRKSRQVENDHNAWIEANDDKVEVDVPGGQVFISYANEPDASHAQMVRKLADRLREQGVDAFLDLY